MMTAVAAKPRLTEAVSTIERVIVKEAESLEYMTELATDISPILTDVSIAALRLKPVKQRDTTAKAKIVCPPDQALPLQQMSLSQMPQLLHRILFLAEQQFVEQRVTQVLKKAKKPAIKIRQFC